MKTRLTNNINIHYLKSLNTDIHSKVVFTDPFTKEDSVITLFDEYQLKWFDQLTTDELYDYFQEVIAFYKAEEEVLCQSSNTIDMQTKFSTGYNYGIIQRDNYSMRNDEDDEDDDNMWITQGYKNNYGVAVYKELERVCYEHEKLHDLENEVSRLQKSESV